MGTKMTDQMLTTAPAEAEADRKTALIAEGEKLGLKLDKRYSVERMEAKIAEAKAGPAPVVQAAPKSAVPVEDVEALKARLAAAEAAAAAAKPAEPAPQPYNAPKGMTTTMDMNLPGALTREEEDKRRLMARCTEMGIAHKIPARANPDAIREIMGRHMAENAQKLAAQEAQARMKTKAPEVTYVQMRVLPLGHKKISKGIHIPGIGDEMYELGDIIDLDYRIAKEHHDAGRGEILRA